MELTIAGISLLHPFINVLMLSKLIFSALLKHKEYYNYSTIWMDKIVHKNNATEIEIL